MVKLLDFVSFPNSTNRFSNSDLFIDYTDSLYNDLTVTEIHDQSPQCISMDCHCLQTLSEWQQTRTKNIRIKKDKEPR